MASDDNKKPLSFGFSKKKKETKILEQKNGLGLGLESSLGTTGSANEHDLITSLEGKRVVSAVPREEPKELVIPLLKRNTWSIGSRSLKKPKLNDNANPEETNDSVPNSSTNEKIKLEEAAVQEIISDTAKQNLEWEDRGNEDMGMSIPLLMRNKVPDGFETDEKLDVSIRPDEATDANYDEVPITQFGLAMLRGMGWKEGEGIGKKTEVVKMLEPKPRPKGQGLGAAPKPPELSGKRKRPLKPGEKRPEEAPPVGYAKGVGVIVTKGPHKNMYGRIEGVDEDNAQLILKLAIGGQTVTVSQYVANIVDDHEYKKYAKDLSRLSKPKDKEQDKDSRNEDVSKIRKRREEEKSTEEKTQRHQNQDDDYERRQKHKEKYKESKHRDDKNKDKYRDSKYKEEYRDSKVESRHPNKDRESMHRRDYFDEDTHKSKTKERSSKSSHWLQADLRVRFIDKVYKKGKYYMSKVNIEDVVTPDQCTCKTDDGYLIYDVLESMLETVIPKSDPGHIMIVLGKHKGKLGIVIKKHKDRQKVDIQLLQDRDKIVHLNYEEICQYAGDIHNNEDF
ncbi:G-patch domain and KOW motifs-containing protein-like [Antedon mediterranea]|uniref:G-patch domain and KOW motifs-containing protein-like n=1 Tax=Antedon mediterranea TaxID=105859 RepID=UPI003AF8F64C